MINSLDHQSLKDFQVRVLLHVFLKKLKVVEKSSAFEGLDYLIASSFELQMDQNGETILVQKSSSSSCSYPDRD